MDVNDTPIIPEEETTLPVEGTMGEEAAPAEVEETPVEESPAEAA